MHALTLKQPWPWAILDLGKRIENRKWRIPDCHIGQPIALHGGVDPSGSSYDEALSSLKWIADRGLSPRVHLDHCIITGVFAVAIFGDPVEASDNPWFFGPWGWPITGLFKLPEPVPCKGKLGLWRLPGDVHDAVMAQPWGQVR